MNTGTTTGQQGRIGTASALWAFLVLLALTLIAEAVGAHTVSIGIGTITFLPLIWGLLLGAAVSIQKLKPVPDRWQHLATYGVQVGILLFATRLAFLVGENIPLLAQVGPALIIQEIGNLFTIAVALPIAVLLGMRRASVGATFSIGRETSFVIVGEKYGAESDEYRGVLAMYVFGTLFGALFVSMLASVVASMDIFSPLALAMGSGVGSGSMMAASSAAIASQYPEMSDQILALAALSNLLSTVLGLYVGIYLALPLADKFYRVLTRGKATTAKNNAKVPAATEPTSAGDPGFSAATTGWLMAASFGAMLLASSIYSGGFSWDQLLALTVITAVVVVAMALARVTRISTIVVVMTLGVLVATPWSPIDGPILAASAPVEFLPMATPVLVLAGLGLGVDVPVLKRIGWRVVPIGVLVFTATFLASAIIADIVLRYTS